MTKTVLSLLLLLFCNASIAQVRNDQAAQAKHLIIDSLSYPSDTRHCTLEEKCIDRQLTAKCLVFHNDQWFTFTTAKDSVYYLSIRNQQCEDINGIQLQVLDGQLCQPSTYELLECISLATQDDIYVTLRNLKHHHTYLLNIDGYLHDLCKFEIGITTTLPDFAIRPISHFQDLNGLQKNGKVKLEWKLTEELKNLKTMRFEVQRRFEQEKKFQSAGSVEVERTVHGDSKTDYQYLDTVGRKGFYYYQIIAVTMDSSKFKIGDYAVLSKPFVERPYLQTIELPCKDRTAVTFLIYNWENNFLVDKIQSLYSTENFKMDFGPYFTEGMVRLKVVAVDKNNNKIKEFLIDRKY